MKLYEVVVEKWSTYIVQAGSEERALEIAVAKYVEFWDKPIDPDLEPHGDVSEIAVEGEGIVHSWMR
jgi:hypothetical protein